MNRTLIVGVGGLCKQLEYHYSQWEDEPSPVFFDNIDGTKEHNCYTVINTIDDLPKDVTKFIIAVSLPKHRKQLTQMCLSRGLIERNVISEDLHMPHSSFKGMGANCIILRNCLIESNVRIGYGSVLNTMVSLHHGVQVGEYVTIGPGVTCLGDTSVGDNSFLGAGSIIREKTKIGNNCIIGMGSIVTKNIPDNEVWYGNPARHINKE